MNWKPPQGAAQTMTAPGWVLQTMRAAGPWACWSLSLPSPTPPHPTDTSPALLGKILGSPPPALPSPAGILEQPLLCDPAQDNSPAPRSLWSPSRKSPGTSQGHQAQSAPPQIFSGKNSSSQWTRSFGHFPTAAPALPHIPVLHSWTSAVSPPQPNHPKVPGKPEIKSQFPWEQRFPSLSWSVPWLVQISWAWAAALPLSPPSCAGSVPPSLAQTPGTASASPRLPKTQSIVYQCTGWAIFKCLSAVYQTF